MGGGRQQVRPVGLITSEKNLSSGVDLISGYRAHGRLRRQRVMAPRQRLNLRHPHHRDCRSLTPILFHAGREPRKHRHDRRIRQNLQCPRRCSRLVEPNFGSSNDTVHNLRHLPAEGMGLLIPLPSSTSDGVVRTILLSAPL